MHKAVLNWWIFKSILKYWGIVWFLEECRKLISNQETPAVSQVLGANGVFIENSFLNMDRTCECAYPNLKKTAGVWIRRTGAEKHCRAVLRIVTVIYCLCVPQEGGGAGQQTGDAWDEHARRRSAHPQASAGQEHRHRPVGGHGQQPLWQRPLHASAGHGRSV